MLIIWGIIGYKIISGINPETPETTNQNIAVNFTPKTNIKADTFSIKTVNRDPFLGTLMATNRKTAISLKSGIKKPYVVMPNITYGGLIKNQQSAQQIFVVNINNRQYLLKKGQIQDEVKLVSGNTKEIVVRFNSKAQTIPIQ